MKYTVVSAIKEREYTTAHGTFVSYLLALKDEQGQDATAKLSQKPETPVPSGELHGSIEETNFGPKFNKEKPAFGGSGGFQGRSSDPEVQAAIIRQNALGNAQAVCIARAGLMTAVKGLAYLTDENILATADHYAQWTSGKAPAPQMVNTAEAFGADDEVQHHPVETPQTAVQAKIASDPRFQAKGEPDYNENPFTE